MGTIDKIKRENQSFFREHIPSGENIKFISEPDTSPMFESPKFWAPFFDELPHRIGLHPAYDNRSGALRALAIVRGKKAMAIHFSPEDARPRPTLSKLAELLTRSTGFHVAFDAMNLALELYRLCGFRVTNLVDVATVFPDAESTHPLVLVKAAVQGDYNIFESNLREAFYSDHFEDDLHRIQDRAMVRKAWLAQFLATLEGKQVMFEDANKINTATRPETQLNFLANQQLSTRRMEDMKALRSDHDVQLAQGMEGMVLQSNRWQNRIRRTEEQQVMQVQVQTDRGTYTRSGAQVAQLEGSKANMVLPGAKEDQPHIISATTFGRDGPTRAESQNQLLMQRTMQDPNVLFENHWFRNIHLMDCSEMRWPDEWKNAMKSSCPKIVCPAKPIATLNPSQLEAINLMLSPSTDHHITLIHGPPGTGKTTVIAQYVEHMCSAPVGGKPPGIWLVAQSNVAVKNIAEKLLSVKFQPWKLLVSKDFQFDWHDHLYQTIQPYVIRSDTFIEAHKQLQGVQVILCTLSMLSNRRISTFTRAVPLIRLVVDEASQIKIPDYNTVFHEFKKTLRKICFIGDPKQLPPFGQEQIEDLTSIFEVEHLKARSHLLNTQYRMPPQIGQFISNSVYDTLLQSNPKHPVPDHILACQFINVQGGESPAGTSSKNTQEIQAAIKLAQHLESQGLSYRIITGYDAQRSLLEEQMKQTPDLDWRDKCFNVDSFQGNEDDYIIISLVKTFTPGFLINARRTNVMLSRCKKGMFILGSRRFVERRGRDTLVGQLAEYMTNRVGDAVWIEAEALEVDTFEVQKHVAVLQSQALAGEGD